MNSIEENSGSSSESTTGNMTLLNDMFSQSDINILMSTVYKNKIVPDIKIFHHNHYYLTHKTILCNASGYLLRELSRIPETDTIILNDIHEDLMEPILNFIYSGSTFIKPNLIGLFLRTCQFLEIKGVEHIKTVIEENHYSPMHFGLLKPIFLNKKQAHKMELGLQLEAIITSSLSDDEFMAMLPRIQKLISEIE